jgi:hypothetical protein
MWGERGLVATFFLDLAADATLARWHQFLGNVTFGPNGAPPNGFDWERIAKVWAVVEPGFGSKGFGSPDLVARLEFKGNSNIPPVVLALEAKTGTYVEAALNPAGRNVVDGFNSSLNGQIELNHRLTLALQAFQPRMHQLIEPEEVAAAYGAPNKRRYVVNPAVLNQLVPHLRGENVRYLHIAITSDNGTPFARNLGVHLPQIFHPPNANDLWAQECHRFGWIGWQKLHRIADENNLTQFLASYRLNQHFLQAPEQLDHEQPPVAWPANRPQVGVSLVFIPNFGPPDTETTAVHFSWNGNSCRIRNYLPGQNPDFAPDLPALQQTLVVLPLIVRETRLGRARPGYTEQQAWQAIIHQTNLAWGLPGNAAP